MRFDGKKRHDWKHYIHDKELAIGSIILLHDTGREKDIFRNSFFK